MKVIWKFSVHAGYRETISVPVGTRLFEAQFQRREIVIWGVVDEANALTEEREIFVLTTGSPMPDEPLRHLGTIQTNGGDYVFHVFEKEPRVG